MTLNSQGIITALKPIGGWRYPQLVDGTVIVVLPEHAPSGHYPDHGEKLVAAVRLFRIKRGIEPGEPARDVAEFIRRVSPVNDYYRGKNPDVIGKPRVREITPLIQDMRQWTEQTILQKPKLVNVAEAAERAEICLRCPQNVRWQTQCGDCNKELEQRVITLRAAVMFDFDPALLGCRAHRIPLQAAVFMDRDYLPANSPSAPEYCWIPKERTSI